MATQRVPKAQQPERESTVPVDSGVASRLEEVSALCLRLESGEKLSAFLASVGRCTALWREYVEEKRYRAEMLQAERLVSDEEG